MASKLLGAGGGGFILFLADPKYHNRIRKNLSTLLYVPIDMESLSGSQLVYYSNADPNRCIILCGGKGTRLSANLTHMSRNVSYESTIYHSLNIS